MPPSALLEESPAADNLLELSSRSPSSRMPSAEDVLTETLAALEAIVPPLWPLKDYVAVNPFLGLSERKFLEARRVLREVRDCELLPTPEYFQDRLRRGEIRLADLEAALPICAEEYPAFYEGWDAEKIVRLLDDAAARPPADERRCFTISEIVDRRRQATWSSHVVNDVTRHCSAHYDEGQAAWPSPWKDRPLYEAWREAARLSRRMDQLGIDGFRSLVTQLPTTPTEAIAWSLRELRVPAGEWRRFLHCQIGSVAGWASYVKYRVREAAQAGRRDEDLVGLLAVRLAYDVALARSETRRSPEDLEQLVAEAVSRADDASDPVALPAPLLARYALQVAAEESHRRKLLGQLTSRRLGPPATDRKATDRKATDRKATDRKATQMIFCIDVRSEVMRRHLESQTAEIETFGFAGFFGMALEYVPLGESAGASQCPVLLRPGFCVHETVLGADVASRAAAAVSRRERRAGRNVWKSFQTSAVSCFSFVESHGLFYFGKMVADSLRLPRSAASGERKATSRRGVLGPDPHAQGEHEIPLAKKIDLGEGMLRNLGLTERFARVVAICGHAAETTNNPYQAGLDCGACGGHSGEPNARVAAALLNDPRVRAGLEARGIRVPDDTWFVPAVHNTTTDEIRLLDVDRLPSSHADDIAQLRRWILDAGRLCRLERCRRLSGSTPEDLFRRSQDWSEVRPEWGLAGNAAFVVAPRARTEGLDLEGRTFLHSYDHRNDPELKVLELIMTAPMIVTNWINLQYYASAVDNRAFGSGNKVLHNVVGQFGVLLGNGGDLMTCLPWQSVHDGTRFQHEPLRLLVVIEATRDAVQRIVEKHVPVRELVENGWLTLTVIEDQQCWRWNSAGRWEVESTVSRPASAVRAVP